MGWDGPQGKPPQAVSTAEPSVSAKPKRPAGRMPAVCRGLRGENAARFRLASYHTAGQNARKAAPHHGEPPFLYGNCTRGKQI